MKYYIDDFTNMISAGFNYTIPDIEFAHTKYILGKLIPSVVVINKIYKINVKVLSTPVVFTKRSDLPTIPPFEALTNQVRMNLNKLTDKTYEKIKENVIKWLDEFINDDEMNNESNKAQLSKLIFESCAANKFYAKISSTLYTELLTESGNHCEWCKPEINTQFGTHFTTLVNTEHIGPNVDDYDKFCDFTKIANQQKAKSKFYECLSTHNECLISQNMIAILIKQILETIVIHIDSPDKIDMVNDMVVHLSTLCTSQMIQYIGIHNDNFIDNKGQTIIQIVGTMAGYKSSSVVSLSSKSLFALQDLRDLMLKK